MHTLTYTCTHTRTLLQACMYTCAHHSWRHTHMCIVVHIFLACVSLLLAFIWILYVLHHTSACFSMCGFVGRACCDRWLLSSLNSCSVSGRRLCRMYLSLQIFFLWRSRGCCCIWTLGSWPLNRISGAKTPRKVDGCSTSACKDEAIHRISSYPHCHPHIYS